MRTKLLSLFFLFFYFILTAQTTVKGIVLDEQNQPIPFVNISVKHSEKGTSTNNKGFFKIILPKKRGKLVFSYIGYHSVTKKITPKTKYLTIILEEDASELDEVIIVSKPKKRLRKKENPAYKILKGIWKNKKKNGIHIVNQYQYKKLETIEIGLNNIDTIFLQKILKKDYISLKDKLPENEGNTKTMPLYIKETVSTLYGDNKTKSTRTDIEAEKSEGIHNNGFVFDKMGSTFSNINIYKNNIPVLKKSFVSPISTAGFETYDYVLHDSTIVNNRKLYHIYFFPRRNGDLAFKGDFWVADKIFSITNIKMTIHKDINLNFVRSLSFEKDFFIKNDSIYLAKKDFYEGDFTFSEDDQDEGLSIKKTRTFSNYIFNSPKSEDFYSKKIIKIRPNQFKKPTTYWEKFEKEDPFKKETYQLIKALKKKKKIRQITNILNILSTGYITVKTPFQLGQYWNTFAKNNVEGLKIKLGFRTFTKDDDRFRLSGFIGYGIKDKRFKFGLETKYLLAYKPRITFGISYLYDIEQLGSKLLNINDLNENVFDPNALFSRGKNFFLSFINKKVIKFDIVIHKNLHLGISGTHNIIKSADQTKFSINYLDNTNKVKSTVTDVSTDVYISYTPGRYVYGFGVEQRIGKNLYPSLIINYHKGYKNILGGDFSYKKIQFNYTHPILLGKFGLLKASIDAGKIFGKVPIALLNTIPANQTFWITKNTFSLMNYYDFVTDTYISGHFEHHFNGLILNKIPLIKKLKLRTVFTYKTVYGTISNKNININLSNIIYKAPTKKMYYEYGIGLENIGYKEIRPLRIDFIWRGEHTSVNGFSSPKSAIRIGIKMGF